MGNSFQLSNESPKPALSMAKTRERAKKCGLNAMMELLRQARNVGLCYNGLF